MAIFGAACGFGLALIALASHDKLAGAFWGAVGLFLAYRGARPARMQPTDQWDPKFQIRLCFKLAGAGAVLTVFTWSAGLDRPGGLTRFGEVTCAAFATATILLLVLAAFYSTVRGEESLRRMRAKKGA